MSRKCCILLSTYNGVKFLKEQVESALRQDDSFVYVRDDGSSDGTVEMLRGFRDNGEIILSEGTNLGPAASFIELLRNAPAVDYYAFCDQDDVWKEGKIDAAVRMLERCGDDIKCYYGSYTPVDRTLKAMGDVHFDDVPPTLESVLGYNSAVGATMVISRALKDLICSVRRPNVYMHDWWALLVCLTFHGRVLRDEDSYLLYRQHGNNVVGCNRRFWSRFCNKLPWSREQRRLNGVRVGFVNELLALYGDRMDADSFACLSLWQAYKSSFARRVKLAVHSLLVNYTTSKLKKHVFLALDILSGKF